MWDVCFALNTICNGITVDGCAGAATNSSLNSDRIPDQCHRSLWSAIQKRQCLWLQWNLSKFTNSIVVPFLCLSGSVCTRYTPATPFGLFPRNVSIFPPFLYCSGISRNQSGDVVWLGLVTSHVNASSATCNVNEADQKLLSLRTDQARRRNILWICQFNL